MNKLRHTQATRGPRSASRQAQDRQAQPQDPEDKAGSGPRRRSSQPNLPRDETLPPLEAPRAAAHEEDDVLDPVVTLLIKLDAEGDGMLLPPPGYWGDVADKAKRRKFVTEHGLRLYFTKRGRQELESRAQPEPDKKPTMIKIFRPNNLLLKDLAIETGQHMQDVVGFVIAAVHEHRDALTRVARANGLEHPWEGIGMLLKSGARRS